MDFGGVPRAAQGVFACQSCSGRCENAAAMQLEVHPDEWHAKGGGQSKGAKPEQYRATTAKTGLEFGRQVAGRRCSWPMVAR